MVWSLCTACHWLRPWICADQQVLWGSARSACGSSAAGEGLAGLVEIEVSQGGGVWQFRENPANLMIHHDNFLLKFHGHIGISDFQTHPGSHCVLCSTAGTRLLRRKRGDRQGARTSPANAKQWTSKSWTYPHPARFFKVEQITICGYQTWQWNAMDKSSNYPCRFFLH